MKYKIACIGIIFSVYLMGCTALMNSYSTPTITPSPTQTLKPTLSPILYENDFSHPAGDWWVNEDENGTAKYQDQTYHITANKGDRINWSVLEKKTFYDGVLNFTYQKISGDENTGAAVFWRIMDTNNFYGMQITSEGYYSIFKYLDSNLVEIVPWKKSSLLLKGFDANFIMIVFEGHNIDIYFNNKYETNFTDLSFPYGKIALGAFPTNSSDVEIIFSDLIVDRIDTTIANAKITPIAPQNANYTSITWQELADFLVRDHTNWNTYNAEKYNCLDFAVDLVENARKENLKVWFVGVDFTNGDLGHAFVAFETSDKGTIYIEPQRDYTYSTLAIGNNLCDDWGKDYCMGVVNKIEYFWECDHNHYCSDYVP